MQIYEKASYHFLSTSNNLAVPFCRTISMSREKTDRNSDFRQCLVLRFVRASNNKLHPDGQFLVLSRGGTRL